MVEYVFLSNGKSFFDLLWDIHADSARENPSTSMNSTLITLDGSILLVVWPRFLQIHVFFRKTIWQMLSLHNEAASLCDRLELRGGGGDKERGVTPKARWGICCHPKDKSGTETVFPSMSGNGAHKAKAVTNPGEGAWPEPGCPPPSMWCGDTPTDAPRAFIIYLFNCGHTCLHLYNRNDSSWSIHFVAGVGINREERRQHSLCTPMPFGIVKLIISFSGTGNGGRYSQTKMFAFPTLFPIADFYSHRCPETEAIYLSPIHKS